MPREHKRRERIVDHGLVVNRHNLLGNYIGHRMETSSAASRENDFLHRVFNLHRLRRRLGRVSTLSSSC